MPTPPAQEPRLLRVAALVADASRARMLCLLLGGELASAGELAAAAGVSASTASGHLAQLLDGGLLACEARGRHRYYRLADAEVAHALEALALVAERDSHARQWASPARQRLRAARCCYGHLAGQLGVALLRTLQREGWLIAADSAADSAAGNAADSAVAPGPGAWRLSDLGAQGLSGWGLDGADWQRRSASAGRGGRGVAYGCLDWSERRDHLAGPLASALLQHFLARDWLRRSPPDRALSLTPTGQAALGGWLGWPR